MAKSGPKPPPAPPAPQPPAAALVRDSLGNVLPPDVVTEPVRMTYHQVLRTTSVVETARTLRGLMDKLPPEAGGRSVSYATRSHRNTLPDPLAAAFARLAADLDAVLALAGPGPGNT